MLVEDATAVAVDELPHSLQETSPLPSWWRSRPSWASSRSTTTWTAMAAWSMPGSHRVGIALHAVPADEDVGDGVFQGVAEVELTRQVGRRHDDGEGLSLRVDARREVAALLPEAVQPLLHRSRVVGLGDVRRDGGPGWSWGAPGDSHRQAAGQFGAVKSRFYEASQVASIWDGRPGGPCLHCVRAVPSKAPCGRIIGRRGNRA